VAAIVQVPGWILDVEQVPIGTALLLPAAVGDTVLVVQDAVEFSEYGGFLNLNGLTLRYVSADLDEETLTLFEPLTVGAEAEDDVYLWDDTNDRIAAQFAVTCEFENDELGDDDAAPATLHHSLGDRVKTGVRNGRGESCTLQRNETGSSWTVVSVEGVELQIDLGFADPATIPASPRLTDNLAPAVSPTPVLEGGLRMLFASWVEIANNDPVIYDVFTSQTLPVVADSAHFDGSTMATGIALSKPAGTWHMVVQARDDDGLGPVSDPGTAVVETVDLTPLQTDISQLETDLTQLDTDLGTLQGQVTTVQGKFPIVTTDITPGAITTPTMTANTINGDRVTANTLNALKILAGSIATDRMTANTIQGDRIAANTLNADRVLAGSVTTDRMTANTINGDRILANTLHADKIIANTISANHIAADAITAKHTITGAMYRTAVTGERIEMSTTNASAIQFFSDHASANPTYPGMIYVDTLAGANGIQMMNIQSGGFTGFSQWFAKMTIDTVQRTSPVRPLARFNFSSDHVFFDDLEDSESYFSVAHTKMYLGKYGANGYGTDASTIVFAGREIEVGDSAVLHLTRTADSNVGTNANYLPAGNAAARPALVIGPYSGQHLRIDNNEIISIASDDGGTAVQGTLFLNPGGTSQATRFESNEGGLFANDQAGTGTVAAQINANGRILRSSSSERVKRNVRTLSSRTEWSVKDRLLRLEPILFQRKPYDDKDPDDQTTYAGFSAEQAAEVGLEPWVQRDSNGGVQGFAYEAWTAALQLIAQQHEQEIRDLTRRLQALEQRGPGAPGTSPRT
jgi:hypothetical protein